MGTLSSLLELRRFIVYKSRRRVDQSQGFTGVSGSTSPGWEGGANNTAAESSDRSLARPPTRQKCSFDLAWNARNPFRLTSSRKLPQMGRACLFGLKAELRKTWGKWGVN
ncbi:uncharacterized protein BO96DRAFT_439107 [Aspergillus niger CBS 101883]|uniref:Uncharacterized protein n=2 Tax=Aspergillus niger TaxID=5061 RepID=A2QUF2_ASPNC|nr:uncharacterized protein BO96DRAFT_439107 [Aspergillus niger CBS 101883]XP_059606949.1 hypothetical protein An09g05440 [Aspergillus niger]PYH51319.1 hypothetical protein BO96DRAFT_439107 [Aspergillus niger CBS 101883]CAL00821.1 hypothetical protein An09g05440 [Aspergillus niger]